MMNFYTLKILVLFIIFLSIVLGTTSTLYTISLFYTINTPYTCKITRIVNNCPDYLIYGTYNDHSFTRQIYDTECHGYSPEMICYLRNGSIYFKFEINIAIPIIASFILFLFPIILSIIYRKCISHMGEIHSSSDEEEAEESTQPRNITIIRPPPPAIVSELSPPAYDTLSIHSSLAPPRYSKAIILAKQSSRRNGMMFDST